MTETTTEAVDRLIRDAGLAVIGGAGMMLKREDLWALASLVAERDALSNRVAELKAENTRLQAILNARDAYDMGEPSRPPQTGKPRAALQGDKTDG